MIDFDSKLEDYLLPDLETTEEYLHDEDDDCLPEVGPSRGIFSENPENAALWMERVSHRFVKAA